MVDKNNWERYHQQWVYREQIPANPRTIKAILSTFDVKNKKILEVGSATGRDSIYLAKLGAKCLLLDYAQLPLETAKKLADKLGIEIQTIRADANNIPLEDGYFDLVYSQGLIEHFVNPLELITEQVRVLKKGGYLLIDVPQKYHIYTLIKHFLMRLGKWTPGWETEYTIGQLETLIKNSGLESVSTYGDWSHPPLLLKLLMSILKIPYKNRAETLLENHNGIVAKLKKNRLAHYTFQHIGIIAKK